MTKGNNLFVRIHEDKARFIHHKNDKITIRLGGKGSISWLNSKGKGGDDSIGHLTKLHRRHHEFKKDLEGTLFGFTFRDELGKKHAVKTYVEEVEFHPENESIKLTATIADNIVDTDHPTKVDHHDRVGGKFARKHNDWSIPFGKHVYKDVDAYLDTFSPRELKKFMNGAELGASHDLHEGDINAKFRFVAPRTATLNGPYKSRSFNLININKTKKLGGSSSLSYAANVTPSVTASFNPPNSFWDILDYDKYSISTTFGVNWKASTTLDTGSDNGKFKLYKETIKGPSATLPITGVLSANLGTGLDLEANATLKGLKSKYTLSASQNMDFTTDISTRGIQYSSNVPAVKTVIPKIDPITGFGLDATAAPWLQLKVGMIVPSGVPYYGGDSLATLNGKISVPVTFDYEYDGRSSAQIGAKVNLSGSASVFEFAPGGGWDFPIADKTIYNWNSGNLLA